MWEDRPSTKMGGTLARSMKVGSSIMLLVMSEAQSHLCKKAAAQHGLIKACQAQKVKKTSLGQLLPTAVSLGRRDSLQLLMQRDLLSSTCQSRSVVTACQAVQAGCCCGGFVLESDFCCSGEAISQPLARLELRHAQWYCLSRLKSQAEMQLLSQPRWREALLWLLIRPEWKEAAAQM